MPACTSTTTHICIFGTVTNRLYPSARHISYRDIPCRPAYRPTRLPPCHKEQGSVDINSTSAPLLFCHFSPSPRSAAKRAEHARPPKMSLHAALPNISHRGRIAHPTIKLLSHARLFSLIDTNNIFSAVTRTRTLTHTHTHIHRIHTHTHTPVHISELEEPSIDHLRPS